MSQVQNFENHTKFVPAFHFFVLPVLLLNVVWSIVRMVRHLSFETIALLLVAIALFLLAFTARIFALTVQDRLIRLEMRLRMQQVLPSEMRARIPEFTVSQLVSLRFAGDGELPELARKVLDEKLTDRKTIKKLIRDWQPDLLRA
ncbi:MAG TPA: DUF6526 family protein [Candidatus Acidoferrum sp.]|nr:DUF6526 family protein [Candidatus Acidoferrum sp.]